MTAAPILAAAVVLGLLASVFVMNPDQQVEFLSFVRLMCGEPSAPRLREQSPYAAVWRAAGVGSYSAADYHPASPEPKVSPYEARAEGDEKHDAPPLELREHGLSKPISAEALLAAYAELGDSPDNLKN
ncbi:MAG TPA: hypothetical protein PLW65_29305 [Pseudomonadota bacterium]|nr:hypothetical protein [Pseudomonadota bacterium]